MFLRRELPQLFEVSEGPRHTDTALFPYDGFVHMFMTVFSNLKTQQCMKDVMAVTPNPDCKLREYEVLRLLIMA